MAAEICKKRGFKKSAEVSLTDPLPSRYRFLLSYEFSYEKCSENSAKSLSLYSRAAKRGGFQTGVFPDLDLSFLSCPFLSFLGLSRFFWEPIKSTNEEQSRKGPRHNLDRSLKKWETPGLETPRFSFSQFILFPGKNQKEIHRLASAGAQAENAAKQVFWGPFHRERRSFQTLITSRTPEFLVFVPVPILENLWIALKIYSQKSSWELACELLGKSGTFWEV